MEHIDTLVIGAGAIGLALGAKLSQKQNLAVIEQENHFGEHSSSRNSEVIHAGIYYATDSLKAKLCVRGKDLLYSHCEKFSVPHRRVGKLLISQSPEESQKLDAIYQQAQSNAVNDLEYVATSTIRKDFPFLNINRALWSPSTGIIDSHQFLLSLLHIIEQNHGHYVPNTKFIGAQPDKNGFIVELQTDEDLYQIHCARLINAGGLFATANAKRIEGLAPAQIPETHFCRGQYFAYHGKHPFETLVYPTPEHHGLGIHATLDLASRLRFGPDTKFINDLDYTTDETAKEKFVQAIKRYWPALDESKLQVDYCGIRPKLQLEGAQDFVVQNKNTHAIEGLINLFGIESPGLTASLSLAEYVADLV